MATVYLAEDLMHDRKVALKVLTPEYAAVLGAERFVEEIKTTAALQHTDILALLYSGEADGFRFRVMPLVDVETLCDRLNRQNILLQNGSPMLADFDVAPVGQCGSRRRRTETGLSLGTPHYMSTRAEHRRAADLRPQALLGWFQVARKHFVGRPARTESLL